jgi:hypothetical protein
MAGPLVALRVVHLLRRRWIRQWVVAVFIPEAEKAGIDFGQLAVLLQELPARIPDTDDDLRFLRENTEALVGLLAAPGAGAGG